MDESHAAFRVVRVHVSTGYNRVEGNRRASRNGRVSDLPPESLTIVAVKVHAAALSWTAAESEPGECCRQQPVRLEEVSVAAVDAAFDALLRQGPPALHKTPSLTLREEEEQEPAAATEDAEEVRAPFNV